MSQALINQHISEVLPHLYINPLEKCNLHCKICYTRKTAPVLTEAQIMDFGNFSKDLTEVILFVNIVNAYLET